MKSSREFWTVERVALLKELRENGVAYAAIAARLGVTRNAISGKVDRLGLGARQSVPRGRRETRPVLRRRPVVTHPVVPMLDGAPSERIATEVCPKVDGVCRPPGSSPSSGRTTAACGLLDLNNRTCRWPVGDPGEADFFFCGDLPDGQGPYCAAHRRLAYRPFDVKPLSEFAQDREPPRVLQPDTRFGQFADWDVT